MVNRPRKWRQGKPIGDDPPWLAELNADRQWREDHANEVAEVHRVFDLLIGMVHASKEPRRCAYWEMPAATREFLLALRCDRSGPVWTSYDGGEPGYLLGYPVRVVEGTSPARRLSFVNGGRVRVMEVEAW